MRPISQSGGTSGRRVMGSHFLPVSILSFVHSYNSCSKIAFQLAQIYNNLSWNVTVEASAAERNMREDYIKINQ